MNDWNASLCRLSSACALVVPLAQHQAIVVNREVNVSELPSLNHLERIPDQDGDKIQDFGVLSIEPYELVIVSGGSGSIIQRLALPAVTRGPQWGARVFVGRGTEPHVGLIEIERHAQRGRVLTFAKRVLGPRANRPMPWLDAGTYSGDWVADSDAGGLSTLVVSTERNDVKGESWQTYGGLLRLDTDTWNILAKSERKVADDGFGRSIAALQDRDGDGVGDFIVGAPGISRSGKVHPPGRAFVVSGCTFEVLETLEPIEHGASSFGTTVCAGDQVANANAQDVLVGSWLGAEVSVFSGAPLRHRTTFRDPHEEDRGLFGRRIVCLGDLDADGRSDYLVSAPYAKRGGRIYAGAAYVFSGADGALLLEFGAAVPGHDQLGEFCAAVPIGTDRVAVLLGGLSQCAYVTISRAP